MQDRRIPLENLKPLIFCQILAEIRYIITAGLEGGFFGEPLEWTVPSVAVFETWAESDRGDSLSAYVE